MGAREPHFRGIAANTNQRHAPLCKPRTICQWATWAQHLYNSWRQNVVAGNSSQGAQRAEHILDCCIRLTGFDLESLWADVSHCRNCTQAVPPVLAPVWEKWPAGEGLHSKSNKKRVGGGGKITCHNPSLATVLLFDLEPQQQDSSKPYLPQTRVPVTILTALLQGSAYSSTPSQGGRIWACSCPPRKDYILQLRSVLDDKADLGPYPQTEPRWNNTSIPLSREAQTKANQVLCVVCLRASTSIILGSDFFLPDPFQSQSEDEGR